jgi:hypothetical protein
MHIEIEANHAEMSDFTWFHWEGQARWSCIIIYASRLVADLHPHKQKRPVKVRTSAVSTGESLNSYYLARIGENSS